jgi:hypothetical protein
MAKQSSSQPVVLGVFPASSGNSVEKIFPGNVLLNDTETFTALLKTFQADIEDYVPTFVYKGSGTGRTKFEGKVVGTSEIVRVDVVATIPGDAVLGMWKLTFVQGGNTIDADKKAQFKIEKP